jgi:hypothetical protein
MKIKLLTVVLFLSPVAIGQNNARMTQKELMTAD